MNEITIRIPNSAADLIVNCGLNTNSAYAKFVRKDIAPTMVIKTYGMWVTDIIRTFDDGKSALVGNVVYWENGMITCSRICDDMSELIGVVDFTEEKRFPTAAEYLGIWKSFCIEPAQERTP